jgi:hypothetical protein
MPKNATVLAGAFVLALLPSMSIAKTLIPYWYKCNFTHKEGKYYCATTCVDTRTGRLVSIYPAVCR